jgi:hypothetical protein
MISIEFFRSQGINSSYTLYVEQNKPPLNVIHLGAIKNTDSVCNITQEIIITEENQANNHIELTWRHFGLQRGNHDSPKLEYETLTEISTKLLQDANTKLSLLDLPQLEWTKATASFNAWRFRMRFDWANPQIWVNKMRQVAEVLNNTYIKEGYRAQVIQELKELSK